MAILSIIVPVYNVESYLEKCIESILNQTFKDFELILVNDGSTDKSFKIIKKYSRIDNRIRYITKKNGGLSDARNTGIELATGNYITFVDGDDYIEQHAYELMFDSIAKSGAEITTCGRFDIIDGKKHKKFCLSNEQSWTSNEAIRKLLMDDSIDSSVCDKIFKKDLFKEVKFPYGKLSEDLFVTVKLIQKANKVHHIGKPLYNYNHRDGSITKSEFKKNHLDALEAVKKMEDFFLNEKILLKKELLHFKVKITLYLMDFLINSHNFSINKDSYQQLKEIIRINIIFILFNKKFSARIKLFSISISLNLYFTYKKIKKFLKF
jgi:glycosyltransferase involved in cell wall biosynthesis